MEMTDRLGVLHGAAVHVLRALAELPVTIGQASAESLGEDLGIKKNTASVALRTLLLAGFARRACHGRYEASLEGRRFWWFSRELFDGVSEKVEVRGDQDDG